MQNEILITSKDQARLSTVVDDASSSAECIEALRAKLARSVTVKTPHAPADLVTMNSMVRGLVRADDSSEQPDVRIVTLTYPHSANDHDGCVSVLTWLGVQLLGARAGDVVKWRDASGRASEMVVDSVIFQPETSGDWHL